MADNKSVTADASGKFEDWIEIYNFGDDPVDIGGLYFTDDVNKPKLFRLPTGNDSTLIPSKGFLVLWADDDWDEGVCHLPFKLSRNGEQIAIFDENGKNVIDSLTFSMQFPDKSFGRISDKDAEWIVFDEPTPGSKNK